MSGEMSLRKKNALARRRPRLPEEFRAQSEECAAITELRSRPLPPEPPFVEQDDRRQRVIARELAHVTDSDTPFHSRMPRIETGIF